jgi:hypothetical protein
MSRLARSKRIAPIVVAYRSRGGGRGGRRRHDRVAPGGSGRRGYRCGARVAPSCADGRGCRGTGRRATVGRRLRTRCEYDQTHVLSAVDRTRVLRAAAQVADRNRINSGDADACGAADRGLESGVAKPRRTNIGADALLVRASGQTPTFLAGLLGIRQLDIAASATAALTPLGEVPPGGLPAPVGIASGFVAQGPIDGKRVVFYQAGSSGPCTGWTTFTQGPATVAGLQTMLSGLTTGSMSSPAATANRSRFQFVRGNLTAIFPQIKALYDAKKIRRPGSGSRSSRSTNAAPVRRRPVPFVSPDFRPPSSRWFRHRTDRSSRACCGAGAWPSDGAAVPIMEPKGVFPAWCRDGAEGVVGHA